MSYILDFPQFSAIHINMFQEMTDFCRNLDAGVSEFSFSNDYYKYNLLPRDNDTHGIGIVLLSIYEVLI